MPKIERLSWLAPLTEGRGVTLSNDPAADLFLAENANGLLIGVLLDTQFPTRQAFTSPYRLHQRLGHLDLERIAGEEITVLEGAFAEKPALHRFPYRCARLTQQLAGVVTTEYGGDAARIWLEASDVEDLGFRVLALPSFGEEKTNWTVGMLGTLGMLPYGGWEEFRVKMPRRKAKPPVVPDQSGPESPAQAETGNSTSPI
jgi:uncharacterized HhH-GPD family protein